MGISPGVALILFLVLGVIFLALAGLVYVVIGFFPSPSADAQSVPSDERFPSTRDDTSTPPIPPQFTRGLLAFSTAVIWFVLWVIFTNVLLWKPKDSQLRNISAEAFGYASVSVAGLAIVIWCAVWLWRRFVQGKGTL
jgi:hypothetical protein